MFLIAMGNGARVTLPCVTVGLDTNGMRIGEDVGLGDVFAVIIDDAVVDTGDVCGSLGSLLKALRSHEGASFDAKELRGEFGSRGRRPSAFVGDIDRLERNDRKED